VLGKTLTSIGVVSTLTIIGYKILSLNAHSGAGLSGAYSSATSTVTESLRVLNVADGDTLSVFQSGKRVRVRFACIDAPEITHGNKPEQPFGQLSKQYLESLVTEAGGTVQLRVTDSDRYGRLVAEVFTTYQGQQKFVNAEIIRAGLAYSYQQYFNSCPDKDAILAAESEAKQAKRGVWSQPNLQRPWDYRHNN
jgi:endonuclease YncB( thermonuclease family)